MGEMTLREVRDEMLAKVEAGVSAQPYFLAKYADAIDAHLSKSGEPVGTMVVHEDREMVDNWGVVGLHYPVVGKLPAGDYLLYISAPPIAEPAQLVEAMDDASYRRGWHAGYNEGMTHKGTAEEAFQRGFDAALAHPRPAVPDCDKAERMLSELVDKIVPGLDTGDLLADAVTASRALDASPTGEQAGDVVRELLAREYDAFGQPDSAVFVREGNDIPDDWLIHVTTALRIAEQASAQTRPAAPESGGG